MIQTRRLETLDRDRDTRQELDRDFLGSGYRRRVFVASDPEFTWKSRPQRSAGPLTLIPIPVDPKQKSRLRFRTADGGVQIVDMEAGHTYYVPPKVPYQVESHGVGVFEIFSPVTDSGRLFDDEVLPEDFFDAAAAGADG